MNDRTTLERHIGTGLQAIMVALLVWVGMTAVQVREDVVKLQEQLSGSITIQIEANTRGLRDHETRIRDLERR